MVNISDLDLHTLILALWMNSKFMDFFQRQGITLPPPPTYQEIDTALRTGNNYIDHINGRPIHVDFDNLARVDATEYNKLVGSGAFEKIIRDMRRSRTLQQQH